MKRYGSHKQYHLVCFLATNFPMIAVSEGDRFVIVAMGERIFWSPEAGFQPDCKDAIISELWESLEGKIILEDS